MVEDYVLMNGKCVRLEFEDEYDTKKGMVRVLGQNECFSSRRYGVFSPYTDMTYDVRVLLNGAYHFFHYRNMLQAEGMAVLGAYCTNLAQLTKVSKLDKETLMSYAVSYDATRKMNEMANEKLSF